MSKAKPKRVLVWVEGGCAYAKMDKGVEWELIDWDCIRAGQDHPWDQSAIDGLAAWGKGLVSKECLAALRRYAETAEDE